MVGRFWQGSAAVGIGVSLVMCLSTAAVGAGQEIGAGEARAAEERLREACDGLIKRAVVKRYGMAWAKEGEAPRDASGRGPVSVDLSPRATPAAGLVLHLAGELLDEPRYREAAVQVARGIAGAQERSGRVPANGVFATGTASGRDEAAVVPDRGPTRAAIGLWLTIVGAQKDRDARLSGAAARGVTWLLRQQTGMGAWTIGVKDEDVVQKWVKLDEVDYRDSTFAVLLAGRVTPEFRLNAAAERAVGQLLKMRVQGPYPLWGTLYTGEGVVKAGVPGTTEGVNLLATRYAMQTLLGHALATSSASSMEALGEASKAVTGLRHADGVWPPFYVEGQREDDFRGSTFEAPRTGTWGLPEILRAAGDARVLTPGKYVGLLKAGYGLEQQLALTLAGLMDVSPVADFPVGMAEVGPYLAAHPEFGVELEKAAEAGDLAASVQRAYRWVVRTKLEMKRSPRPVAATLPVTSDKAKP